MKNTGNKTDINNNQTCYFYCNRSGFYNAKGQGDEQLKSQGTSKLHTYCTASIKTTTDKNTEQISAEICKTHYGHTSDLGHIHLSENTRLSVVRQLHQGVLFQHILDEIRDSIGGELKRIHLITRKDLHNIERSFHLNSTQRHKDDATSLQCWVNNCEGKETNPVLLYKGQGLPQANDTDNLSDNDFVLCLQTPLQATLLKRFGDQKIFCIDSTHGTNSYNFTLVTVLVVDEFVNREDFFVLEQFFKAIKRRIGSITPTWFMFVDQFLDL